MGKMILKDGTEYEIDNISYNDIIGNNTDDLYSVKVVSEENPKEQIEVMKSKMTSDNLSEVTIIFTNDEDLDEEKTVVKKFAFSKLIRIQMTIRGSSNPFIGLELN